MSRRRTAPAVRSEADDLRVRSERLREHSRDLRYRSQLWRDWTPSSVQRDVASPDTPDQRPPDPVVDVQRLLRAEVDLEGAIANCKSVLAAVRRELRWRDPATPSVIH